MTSTMSALRPRRTRRLPFDLIAPIILLIGAVLLAVNIARSEQERRSITFENRTGAYVTVRVAGQDRDGWLGLGTLDPEVRTSFEEVADQGRVWRFELTVGRERIGELTRTKQQLRVNNWNVIVAADAADALPEDQRSFP